ncbi:ATP-binding protein [Ornithinimicrobium flavum]|uniref:ATP-binding protein n=1 Tax=Ornithinimicrobium flavum TaxID=1288636 RepID=UPI001070543F|nr:AAA family ATPase [Ornithinimicrobium flavum]
MAPAGAGRTLEVRLVGRVAVRTTAGWRDDWPRPAARRLVALLALSPTRSVPREVVADRLFGHLPPERGLRNVSKALSQARVVLGPGLLEGDSATVWITGSVQVRTDLDSDVALAERVLDGRAGPVEWADLRAVLARADQLLSEDLYEDWAQEPRRRHEALISEAALALARGSGLASDWGRVLTLEPCHVEAWSEVLDAAAARGASELGIAWEECRLVHAQELQRPPPPELRRLADRLRSGPGSPAAVDPTVGHRDELRWIEARLPTTARGGDSWVLFGPAGIGKTHLLRRAVDGLRERGCLVLQATCVSEDAGGPFTALLPALRPAARAGSHPLVDVLERGGSGGPEGWSAVRLADDVADLLDECAEPLVLVVDDVHWAHPALRSLLSRLCALVAGRRWSLVLAGRSDETDHPLPSVPSATFALRVSPLSPQDASELARRLLWENDTDDAGREGVVCELVARSAGNPFFLIELARSAGSSPAGGHDVPERVQELLRRRLAEVDASSRHTLVLVALSGERATLPLLARMVGEERAERSVRVLQARSLLTSGPSGPRPIHPLLREVVIADLSAVEACAAHDQLAAALGALSRESGRPDLEEAAAGHTLTAWTAYPSPDRAPGAAAAGLAAGGRALRSFAPDTAAGVLERALAAFGESPPEARAALVPAAVEGWLDLARCRELLGNPVGAEEALRAGLALADRPLDRARCSRRLAALHYRSGRMADAAGVLELALAETTDDLARAMLETEIGWTLHRRGRAREALPLLRRAAQVFEDGGSWDLAAWALDYLAMTHVALDEPAQGLSVLDRALARDGVGQDHLRRGVIVIHRARVLLLLRRPEEALGAVNEGMRILRRTRDRYTLSVGCRIAADVHETLGDLSSAVAARTEEIALLRGSHNARHLAVAHAHLASLHRRQGRHADSRTATAAARAAVAQAGDADVEQAVSARLGSGNTAGTPGS